MGGATLPMSRLAAHTVLRKKKKKRKRFAKSLSIFLRIWFAIYQILIKRQVLANNQRWCWISSDSSNRTFTQYHGCRTKWAVGLQSHSAGRTSVSISIIWQNKTRNVLMAIFFFLIPNTSVVHSTWTQYTKCCTASFILPSVSGGWQLASKLTPVSDNARPPNQMQLGGGGRNPLVFCTLKQFWLRKTWLKISRAHTHRHTERLCRYKKKQKKQTLHEASRFICPRIPIWGQIKQPVRKMSAQSPRKLN